MSENCNCGGTCCSTKDHVKEIKVLDPSRSSINQPDYMFYVYSFDQNKLLSGWEYKNDALDSASEYSMDLGKLGVYSKKYIINKLKINPDIDGYWGKDHNVSEYKNIKEEFSNLSNNSKSDSDKKVKISITPIDSSLEDTIAAFENIDNYGKHISSLRNTKIGLEKAIENHFGPSRPALKLPLEKAKGEKFPPKTKQALDQFIKEFSSKPNMLYFIIDNDGKSLSFPEIKNPPLNKTAEIIKTVLDNANIEYYSENIEINETLSKMLTENIRLKRTIRKNLNKILTEDVNSNRYVVTLDLYIYANNDDEALKQAEQIADKLQQEDDNKASVVNVHSMPFGSIKSRKIK